jgi:hypothetical protein
MSTAAALHAALREDFARQYRIRLRLLMRSGRHFAAAPDWPATAEPGERASAMLDRAAGLYAFLTSWAGLSVSCAIDVDAPELPLLHAVLEMGAAHAAGDFSRWQTYALALRSAALALADGGRRP